MQKQLVIDGIDVFVEGQGEQTIVMIHGWPDTYRLWEPQVAAFQSSYRCVRFTLPGFDIAKPRRAYSLDETLGVIQNVVQTTSPGQPVILMVHDWGAAFGYQFYARHPELVTHLIGIDIGDANSPEFEKSLPLSARLMVHAYQGWLSLAWQIGGSVGDHMSKGMVKAMRAKSDLRYISAKMNYPYYILRAKAHGSYDEMVAPAPTCPMLFVYGTKKPFMFHTKEWAEQLDRQPGCKVLAMKTDHWPMRSAPAEFNQAVLGWLTAPATSSR